MDGHVAEGSTSRERPNEAEERLKKAAKRPRERNYGVNIHIVVVSFIVIHFCGTKILMH